MKKVATVVCNEAGQVYIDWHGSSMVDFVDHQLYAQKTSTTQVSLIMRQRKERSSVEKIAHYLFSQSNFADTWKDYSAAQKASYLPQAQDIIKILESGT